MMNKIAALKKRVIRELLPYLSEIGNPVEKIRVVRKIGPSNLKLWLSVLRGKEVGEKYLEQLLSPTLAKRRGNIIIMSKLPALEQLQSLVHEALHTPYSLSRGSRVAREVAKRGIIPPEILEGLGGQEKFYKQVFPAYYYKLSRVSEEKGVRLVSKVQTLRLLRILKQENSPLYEQIKKQILKEEGARNLPEVLRKGLSRETWNKEVARYYGAWKPK